MPEEHATGRYDANATSIQHLVVLFQENVSFDHYFLSPIVDPLGKHCRGVLAVHVQPELDVALQAIGALKSQEGRRRLNNACVELNGLLSR